MVRVPVRKPPADGVRTTLTEQLVAAVRAAGQLLVWEKSPEVAILLMLTVPELLAFANNTEAVSLGVPTTVGRNITAIGIASTGPAVGVILSAKL